MNVGTYLMSLVFSITLWGLLSSMGVRHDVAFFICAGVYFFIARKSVADYHEANGGPLGDQEEELQRV